MTVLKTSTIILLATFVIACASSHVITGTPREPIDPSQVKIYSQPPKEFEEIAILEASSKSSWAVTDQGKMNKVIERLKEEAASLGANGVLLQGLGEKSEVIVGSSFGNASAYGTGNTASAYGSGTTTYSSIFHKSGSGIAIYVIKE